VISKDGKTSGILVYIKIDKKLSDLIKTKNNYLDKIDKGQLSAKDKKKYKKFLIKYDNYRKSYNQKNHQNIVEIRKIIEKYEDTAKIHLGGIPMIADDMMTYIKNDIIVFGAGVFLFIVCTLWFVFRSLTWVFIPLLSCFFSVCIMVGLLGLVGWKVTVISSNFIALMLILTMAMNIHMSVRYLQFKKENPNILNSEAILWTSKKMFWPILYTVLTTICAFLSLIFSNIKPIIDFGWMMTVGLLVSLFLGATFIFFNKEFLNVKVNFFEKLFLVIAGFFYFPLLISMPYYLSIYDISFINSYFEAISGFTSTGFTMFENAKEIDEPLLIWRSGSQWLGGLYFLCSLFLLAESPKIKIKNIYTNYEGVNLSEIRNQYTKVLLIYFLLTVLVFVLLTYSGIRLFEGFNLSMTITSAGGFIPTNFLSEIVRSENQKLIFSFSMLIPFFNLYLIYNMIFGDRSLINNKEDLYLLILLLFVLITTYIFFSNIFGFSSILFAVLSSLSNIGLGLDNQFSNLSFLFLILAIIGGSSFSTSSGLKFIKLYTLFKFSLKEIYLLVKPLYVSSNTLFLSKNKIKDEEINIYFLSIVFFISSLFILSGILSFEQINFKDSLTLSILTITNTVNSNNYNLSEFYFLDINITSKISLMLFMVIGRVELLGFLILIKKFFFK